MCGWEIAAFIAAAAASAYGANQQAEAANEAADRQAAALNASMEQQDQWNRKAEGKALENAQEYDTEKRTNRLEEAMKDAGDSLTQSLVTSREQIGLPDQASGKISDEFTADRSSKLADQFQKSVDMARLMGRMRGVQDMLGNEAVTNADFASDLGIISRNAQKSAEAAKPGIELAGKVDAGKVATGALMQSAGTSYLAGGLMKGLGSYFGGAGSAGADVGNGIGNANLSSSSSYGLNAASGSQGLSGGSVSTSGLMNSGSGSMFKLGGPYG